MIFAAHELKLACFVFMLPFHMLGFQDIYRQVHNNCVSCLKSRKSLNSLLFRRLEVDCIM